MNEERKDEQDGKRQYGKDGKGKKNEKDGVKGRSKEGRIIEAMQEERRKRGEKKAGRDE